VAAPTLPAKDDKNLQKERKRINAQNDEKRRRGTNNYYFAQCTLANWWDPSKSMPSTVEQLILH